MSDTESDSMSDTESDTESKAEARHIVICDILYSKDLELIKNVMPLAEVSHNMIQYTLIHSSIEALQIVMQYITQKDLKKVFKKCFMELCKTEPMPMLCFLFKTLDVTIIVDDKLELISRVISHDMHKCFNDQRSE